MKCLVVITAILLTGFASTTAHGQENSDELLGAIAGGVIGSTIGSGDGQKIATVLGVLIGADMARNNTGSYKTYRLIRNWCKNNIPVSYATNDGASRAWVGGCVDRLQREQQQLERQAYNDGVNFESAR